MAPTIDIDPEREEAELRDYMGSAFVVDRLHRYQETLDAEVEEIGDEQTLYRTSDAYLYNLTAFAMTRTKIPYLRKLADLVPPGSRVLDYGCGIGSDGLVLMEAGYDVEFADFDNPSVQYLRWRLERRGLEARIHDLDREVPGGFDASYAFDVIEHVDDPFAFLGEMERRSELVMVNFLEPEPDDQDLHHDLPIRRLVNHAGSRGLRHYKVLHRRSHLVAYEGRPSGAIGAASGAVRVRAVRFAHWLRGIR